MKVPAEIIAAVNAILKPYGASYHDADTPEFLTADEAASFLRFSRSTLYRLTRQGILHPHKFGGTKGSKVLYERKDLVDFALQGIVE